MGADLDERLILCMAPIPAEVLRSMIPQVSDGSGFEVRTLGSEPREEILELASRAEIIIGDFTFARPIDAELVKVAKNAKLIQQPSVGYQHIDLEATKQAGIPVANTAGANSVAVAEHAIMFMLCLLKKALFGHEKTSQGLWTQMEMWPKGIHELAGKVLGIIGLGRIGRQVATRAHVLGCEILYQDAVALDPDLEQELHVTRVELAELLERSDIVTIHVPITECTRRIIGVHELARMKAGEILVNTARAEVVDERALAEAVRNGHLSGAGIDVFTEEPIDPANPLLGLPNVMLSPHTAGATDESRLRILQMAIANVRRVLEGDKPIDVVNGVL